MNETHAKALWNKLETLYTCKMGINKLFLLTKAMHSIYKEGNFVSYHLNELQVSL